MKIIVSILLALFFSLAASEQAGAWATNAPLECVYSLHPVATGWRFYGGNSSFNITTSAGCAWTAVSSVPWITVNNPSGAGSGIINYSVQANNGTERTGTITVGGQTFTITQESLPALSISNVSMFEGDQGERAFPFTVSLSSASPEVIIVNFASADAGAASPLDYQTTFGTLTFAPGETIKTINVSVNGDTTTEANETFAVLLSTPVNALIADGQGTGTIRNDDNLTTGMPFDFDGDQKADLAVFRPSTGEWYLNQSANGLTNLQFGVSSDKIVPADYDGDRRTDIAVYRNGIWYLQRSTEGFTGIAFGLADDIPVPGDYDGDGRADLAVFRPSSGVWYLLQSLNGFTAYSLGQTGDKPVNADYDGDGRTDIAVFRNGVWYLERSLAGFASISFGAANDKTIPADYDGDGLADVGIFRNGVWYIQGSNSGFFAMAFGGQTDVPTPADYDGDGRTDLAVYRPSNGGWYLNRTMSGFFSEQFGILGDKPAANAFIR